MMNNTWRDHVEIAIERSRNGQRFGHEKYRELTADSHPDHLIWRSRITEMVTGIAQPVPVRFPPIAAQAGNAIGALGRAAGQLLSGGQLRVDDTEFERRMTICRACPEYDPASVRCKKCSCFLNLKARLSSENGMCPLNPPKW